MCGRAGPSGPGSGTRGQGTRRGSRRRGRHRGSEPGQIRSRRRRSPVARSTISAVVPLVESHPAGPFTRRSHAGSRAANRSSRGASRRASSTNDAGKRTRRVSASVWTPAAVSRSRIASEPTPTPISSSTRSAAAWMRSRSSSDRTATAGPRRRGSTRAPGYIKEVESRRALMALTSSPRGAVAVTLVRASEGASATHPASSGAFGHEMEPLRAAGPRGRYARTREHRSGQAWVDRPRPVADRAARAPSASDARARPRGLPAVQRAEHALRDRRHRDADLEHEHVHAVRRGARGGHADPVRAPELGPPLAPPSARRPTDAHVGVLRRSLGAGPRVRSRKPSTIRCAARTPV